MRIKPDLPTAGVRHAALPAPNFDNRFPRLGDDDYVVVRRAHTVAKPPLQPKSPLLDDAALHSALDAFKPLLLFPDGEQFRAWAELRSHQYVHVFKSIASVGATVPKGVSQALEAAVKQHFVHALADDPNKDKAAWARWKTATIADVVSVKKMYAACAMQNFFSQQTDSLVSHTSPARIVMNHLRDKSRQCRSTNFSVGAF